MRKFVTIAIGCVLAVLLSWVLAGCSSQPIAYDEQFCTATVQRSHTSVKRCVEWVIAPGFNRQPLAR